MNKEKLQKILEVIKNGSKYDVKLIVDQALVEILEALLED